MRIIRKRFRQFTDTVTSLRRATLFVTARLLLFVHGSRHFVFRLRRESQAQTGSMTAGVSVVARLISKETSNARRSSPARASSPSRARAPWTGPVREALGVQAPGFFPTARCFPALA